MKGKERWFDLSKFDNTLHLRKLDISGRGSVGPFYKNFKKISFFSISKIQNCRDNYIVFVADMFAPNVKG